jgi:alpha-amylase
LDSGTDNASVEALDYDCDSRDEAVLSNSQLGLCVKPSYGGMITELDFRPAIFNLCDVLTRRFEAYHTKVAQAVIKKEGEKIESIHGVYYTKELGLQKCLKYDWYDRGSLIDHFFGGTTTLDKFSDCEYGEVGDFVNQPYELTVQGKKRVGITLKRDGHLWLENGPVPVNVEKTVLIDGPSINVKYGITNCSDKAIDIWHGVEFNLSFSNPHDEKCGFSANGRTEKTSAKTSFGKAANFSAFDGFSGLGIDFEASEEAEFWTFPLWTVSLSDAGFEKTYQGSSVTLSRKLVIEAGATCGFALNIKMRKL